MSRGNAERRSGDTKGARESFSQAAAAARRQGNAGVLARAALGFAGPPWWSWGTCDHEGLELLSEAIEAEPGDLALQSRLHGRLSQGLQFRDGPRTSVPRSAPTGWA